MEAHDLDFDLRYGYWFNLLNERIYGRLDTFLNFIQLIGGSGAALATFNNNPGAIVASGAALAVCAALSLLVQPAVKSERHRVARCRYLALGAKFDEGKRDELIADLSALRQEAPIGFGMTAKIAFNATLDAMALPGKRPLGMPEKILAAIA